MVTRSLESVSKRRTGPETVYQDHELAKVGDATQKMLEESRDPDHPRLPLSPEVENYLEGLLAICEAQALDTAPKSGDTFSFQLIPILVPSV